VVKELEVVERAEDGDDEGKEEVSAEEVLDPQRENW
jgi:hypothetical protein